MQDNFRSFIYRNLHKRMWSVRQDGIVAGHRELVVIEDAEFKVNEGGRARVIREKRKNVHAFVVGVLRLDANIEQQPEGEAVRIGYDPYEVGAFVRRDTRAQVHRAKLVHLMPNGMVYAWGVS